MRANSIYGMTVIWACQMDTINALVRQQSYDVTEKEFIHDFMNSARLENCKNVTWF